MDFLFVPLPNTHQTNVNTLLCKHDVCINMKFQSDLLALYGLGLFGAYKSGGGGGGIVSTTLGKI